MPQIEFFNEHVLSHKAVGGRMAPLKEFRDEGDAICDSAIGELPAADFCGSLYPPPTGYECENVSYNREEIEAWRKANHAEPALVQWRGWCLDNFPEFLDTVAAATPGLTPSDVRETVDRNPISMVFFDGASDPGSPPIGAISLRADTSIDDNGFLIVDFDLELLYCNSSLGDRVLAALQCAGVAFDVADAVASFVCNDYDEPLLGVEVNWRSRNPEWDRYVFAMFESSNFLLDQSFITSEFMDHTETTSGERRPAPRVYVNYEGSWLPDPPVFLSSMSVRGFGRFMKGFLGRCHLDIPESEIMNQCIEKVTYCPSQVDEGRAQLLYRDAGEFFGIGIPIDIIHRFKVSNHTAIFYDSDGEHTTLRFDRCREGRARSNVIHRRANGGGSSARHESWELQR
jgi:hypothetical protein